jgi:hypothetical protein
VAVAHHQLGDEGSAAERFQQAEFACSQVKNDFDLLDAYRTLAQCYLIIGERGKAAEFAELGIRIGVRHSASYPVLTLLMVVAEIAVTTGRKRDAGFALAEAKLLCKRDVLLRNRDVTLYHYFRSLFEPDPAETEAAREAARSALLRELDCIGEEKLVQAFLRVRSFGHMHRDLCGTPPDASG